MSDEVGSGRVLRRSARAVALSAVPLYVLGMGSKIWLDYQLGLEVTLFDVMLAVGFGAFAAVGALLVARRPDNLVSWIMVTIGLMTAVFPAVEAYAAFVVITRGAPDPVAVFGVWANGLYWYPLLALALIYLPLVFPDGHLLSRRWLWVALVVAFAVLSSMLISAFRPTLVGQNIDYRIKNPIGMAGMPSAEEGPLLVVGLAIGLAGAVAAVIVRFRRSRSIERQQMKWFLYAVAFYPLVFFSDWLPVVGEAIFGFVLALLPVAVAIAVLRYRLYDIDVVIRKTLLYTVLTVLLGLVYFGSVILLQQLVGRAGLAVLPRTASPSEQSPLVIVVSTLVIAALFTPLRRRIQDAIDRRFYRKKYNAQQVLAQFAQTARDETDLDALLAELVRVVDETLQPEHVSVWLRPTKSPKGE